MRHAHRLVRRLRRDGLLYSLQRILRRIPAPLFYVNVFLVFALDLPFAVRTPRPPSDSGLRWREAGREDVALLARDGRTRQEIESRFSRCARAWVGESDGTLVGYAWAEPRDLPWDHCLRLCGRPGDIWSFDGWVAPRQRGRGLYSEIKSAAARDCGAAGHRRLLAAVDALNRHSIRANQRIGARQVSRGFILRLFGLCLVGLDGRLRAGLWTRGAPLNLEL